MVFFFHGDLAWDRMCYKKIAEETNPSCWFYTKLCILLFLQTMMGILATPPKATPPRNRRPY